MEFMTITVESEMFRQSGDPREFPPEEAQFCSFSGKPVC